MLVDFENFTSRTCSIGVVGLGYVGVSLVVALTRHFSVYGYDVDQSRVRELQEGHDRTQSVSEAELLGAIRYIGSDESVLSQCKFVILAVPTPIDLTQKPDLNPLESAAQLVGNYLTEGTIVVVESTVFPGVTEDVVRPILAENSNLIPGTQFFVGYSPERINPGDREHGLGRIPKVIAGEEPAVTELMASIYGAISNGVFRARSIKTAEAAKVLENTQRDVNIALINEVSMILESLDVDTHDVIRTASTKWNFAVFEPGLVGGDCIATDPHYLIYAAEKMGMNPAVISSARKVNDGVALYVAERTMSLMDSVDNATGPFRVLILGITFKEDVPRSKNSKVPDLIEAFKERGVMCSIFDPVADRDEVRECHGYELLDDVEIDAPYHAVVITVKHQVFNRRFPIKKLCRLMVSSGGVLVDVKSMYRRADLSEGLLYWRL